MDATEVEGVTPKEHKVSQEQLNRWIETGRDSSDAVAVQGTSIENLLSTVKRGSFIPFTDRMGHHDSDKYLYKDDVRQGNKFLYFAYPIFGNNIISHRSKFNQEIQDAFEDKNPSERNTENYAHEIANEHSFYNATGVFINGWELENFEFYVHGGFTDQALLDELVKNFKTDNPEEFFDKIKDLENRFTEAEIEEILKKASRRKGVLIYFNSEIFNHKVELPKIGDGHDHIVIKTDVPLPASEISGIKFLSEEDEKAFQKMVA